LSLTPDLFRQNLQTAGLEGYFSDESLSALAHFSIHMLQVNEIVNLTKWIEDEAFLTHHLLDSAFALPLLSPLISGPQQWIDLGTGCGFPGAVLAAAFPQVEVSFFDSVAKKIYALEECIEKAGWKAQTLVGRAEEVGHRPQYREQWNGVTARAVADFRVVLEYAVPLLKVGGYLVNWMTEEQWASVDKAYPALEILQSKIIKNAEYSLPGLTQKRILVLVEKLGKTPDTYPRRIGLPSKKPL